MNPDKMTIKIIANFMNIKPILILNDQSMAVTGKMTKVWLYGSQI